DGYPVARLATAGMRPTDGPLGMEGVRRARARAAEADLVLWVTEATAPQPPDPHLAEAGGARAESAKRPVWIVRNKADLLDSARERPEEGRFLVAATTGAGADGLMAALTAFARDYFGAAEPALVTRERQRRLLQDTLEALKRA